MSGGNGGGGERYDTGELENVVDAVQGESQ